MLVGVPLSAIIQSAFREGSPFEPGALTLDHVWSFITTERYRAAAANTLIISVVAVAVAAFFGFTIGWLVERTDVPFRAPIRTVTLVPYFFPTFIGALGWVFLGSPGSGLLNVLLRSMNPPFGPFDVNSIYMVGVILGLYLSPLAFILSGSVISNMDAAMEEAASASGAPTLLVIRKIVMPLMAPGIIAAAVLVFIMALQNFGVPVLLAQPAGNQVLVTQLYTEQAFGVPRYGPGGVIALLLVLALAGLQVLYYKETAMSQKFVTVTGKVSRPNTIRLGIARWPVFVTWLAYATLVVFLPFGVLFYMSLRPIQTFGGPLTLDNYARIFNDPVLLRALGNSFSYATIGSVLTILFALLLVWLNTRADVGFARILDGLATVPIAMPGIVLGTALLWFWVAQPLPVYGTAVIIILVYVTNFLPIAQRNLSAVMLQVSPELEEAALTSGASPARTFASVTFPLLRTGILSSWLLVWLSMFREMSAVIIVYSIGHELLSTTLLQLWQDGDSLTASAIAMVMAAGSLLVVIAVTTLSARLRIPAAGVASP
ncbi:MAG: iron ABC transporter permease [Trueperaceae bacterium]